MSTKTPLFVIVAMYELPGDEHSMYDAEPSPQPRVCLGLRFGGPDDVTRLTRLLRKQVRDGYPEFFIGMEPKEIADMVEIAVYDTEPDRNGYPSYLGSPGWWA